MVEYSDKVFKEIECQSEEWYHAFEETTLFTTLPETVQDEAEFIISVFCEGMYSYCLQTPKEWTTDALEEVVSEVFPRKISATEELFESIEPVLNAFLQFLSKVGHINNSFPLIKALKEAAPIMMEKSKDSSNWGMAKQFMMSAISDGVDLDNIADLQKYIDTYNATIKQTPVRIAPKIGRNDTCPCGSGKKYKKCCGRGL